jgi:hypothetical protein
MKAKQEIANRLEAGLLLNRRREGDRLMLDDATLGAALDGSRALTAGERAALQASPLTARRLRQLALERSAVRAPAWRGSRGMLRAASSGASRSMAVSTDDGWWTLHLLESAAQGCWQAILQLSPQAPFAARLLDTRAALRVLDGAGAAILEGRLDADGECEARWPFAQAPVIHLQAHGAAFTVEPSGPAHP